MKNICWILLAWGILGGLALQAQVPHARIFSTGAVSKDNVGSVGTADLNWQVAHGDTTGPKTDFVPARIVGNCSGILPNSEAFNANWITYDFGKDCEHQAQGCIDLYFRREIVLPATDDCGLPIDQNYCLNLIFRADNSIYAISLNGVRYYRHRVAGDPYKYDGTRNPVRLNLCEGWKPGVNVLIVQVKSCPTIAGLLVEGVQPPSKATTFLGRDTVLCSGNTFALKSPSDNTLWFDETTGKTKTITKDGDYWASYTDPDGCIVTDSISIRFGLKSFFPNVFTPNQDGKNDCYGPQFSHLDFVNYDLRIFDRFGSLVFQSTDPQLCWDGSSRGKLAPEGIYVYALVFQNGECAQTVIKGDLTLLR